MGKETPQELLDNLFIDLGMARSHFERKYYNLALASVMDFMDNLIDLQKTTERRLKELEAKHG